MAFVWFVWQENKRQICSLCLLNTGWTWLYWVFTNTSTALFYVAITGFGIGWASMMGIPYLMVVSEIPKEKYGVYMGIINMMIVIPMFIQTITFGYVMKHFLNNDSTKAILVCRYFVTGCSCTYIANKE